MNKILLFICFFCAATLGRASDLYWASNPLSGDWYTAENWNPQTLPDGPNDSAIFEKSQITDLHLPPMSSTKVARLVFRENGYDLTIPGGAKLTLDGGGVIGAFGVISIDGDSSAGAGQLKFINHATAGSVLNGNRYLISGGNPGGTMIFADHATTGTALIYNSGRLEFHGHSTCPAGITSYAAADSKHLAAVTVFSDQSVMNGGSVIANGGTNGRPGAAVYLDDDSTFPGSFFFLDGNGSLDLSGHNPPGATIADVEGNGQIYLGSNQLTFVPEFRGQSEDVFFAGSFHDGGIDGGKGGVLILSDPGASLTIAGRSDYSGGTIVESGTLRVEATAGSATGAGPVHVNGGTLGGFGKIAGAVTIGTGTDQAATLLPGKPQQVGRTLAIGQTLTFAADGNYKVALNTSRAAGDQAAAAGIAIASGAQIRVGDEKSAALAPGASFVLLSNTAATPIAGTFANLSDGATFTLGENTFQASYEGGDGNDLTLSVVPDP